MATMRKQIKAAKPEWKKAVKKYLLHPQTPEERIVRALIWGFLLIPGVLANFVFLLFFFDV